MESRFFVSSKEPRMSHERDARFHLGTGFVPLAWTSSIGVGALFVIAWLLPRQYSATALIVCAAVAVAVATALGCVAALGRRAPPGERELVAALGSPLLAVRPL